MGLEDLHPDYAISEKERVTGGGAEWLRKKTCLEAVYKSLRRYIRTQIDRNKLNLDYLTVKDNINFDSIAEHDDVQQTMKVATQSQQSTARYKPQ